MSATPRPTAVLTFDVEDWFQSENLRPVCPPARWEAMPRRVAASTRVILDLLAERRIPATFFVLGWVAEREPALVREIAAAGHEIASHGYGHIRPTEQSALEFREDIRRAQKILEDLSGAPVTGYRAPSFALSDAHLGMLAECGLRYDSSFHPFTLHDRYGRLTRLGATLRPGVHALPDGMVELALPVERLGRMDLPMAGGGYFRLYPGALFRALVRRALRRDGGYLFYLHPWEVDPGQPRVSGAGRGREFRHYNALGRTLPRLRRLIRMLAGLKVRFLRANDLVDTVASRADRERSA